MATQLISSTPVLDKLREKGATFYTFSSAINDIDRCMMNNILKMQPSKFVVCKLPNWANLEDIQTLFYSPTSMGAEAGESPNLLFPKCIQNYMENMIQYANVERSDSSYESSAEIAWWKMLKKLKALSLKEKKTISVGNIDKIIYEEIENSESYDSIVKYIGDINILNNISVNGQSYTEIMLYVPTTAGKTSGISWVESNCKFKSNELPTEENNNDYSVGMNEEDYAAKAIYDNELRKYEVSTQESRSGIYFDEDMENTTEGFEFNCVLVYYDLWNVNDYENSKKTNLMGILFMNDMGTTSGSNVGTWPNYNKLNETGEHSGNGYVFRINLKTVNKSTQVSSEVTINDSDTVSMALYLEALKRMNDLSEKYSQVFTDIVTRFSQFDNLISLEAKYGSLITLESRLQTLEKLVNQGANLNQLSSDQMLEMLRTTNQTIKENPDAVVIFNKVTGNPVISDDGSFYVIAPNGTIWKFDEKSGTMIQVQQMN